ncbi:MAG TPA: hypothetical protein VFJ19_20845 [Nocardioidaceae bacterium]|nr:hypothetical protein [Nocardioidaceae bacterium]
MRILHSPSNRRIKGTVVVESLIARLVAEGKRAELITLEGQPNSVVQSALAECDFVFDQVYSDLPWSAFATEAAAHGKACLVSGPAAPLFRQVSHCPPSLYVSINELEMALTRLIDDAQFRDALGAKAHDYLEANWLPRLVAGRLLQVLDHGAPSEWLRNPADLVYVSGCGMAEQAGKQQVRQLVERYGTSALAVPDKPHLEAAFLAYAGLR